VLLLPSGRPQQVDFDFLRFAPASVALALFGMADAGALGRWCGGPIAVAFQSWRRGGRTNSAHGCCADGV